ncbi:GNAT family N-acetyltransferase [Planococcus sp. CP5-4]|uniref:GNAT family N-acetyltransferase n=1 Tax=unclassified Planococcus (in: firmicutes) TaxID=2662419 RepID=UPI001C24A83C|nr:MULTISPECIES: GNAT family N-acetyltransferase [unclassified Planococcus (in: firmicutes)]MBU9672676.1 GNAT family N-acetyltransferase [Planococcus sp. CP5-4_YE]MBV0908450.1 GNAT family N-acetyltransferase [Planococcus sp. CP5-4_UN]MBW6063217.1 GNAT family N-acetyltransferase [Planococcus sp. CP5-4]
MNLKFRPMSEEEFDQFMAFLIPDYAQDLSENYMIPLNIAMEESKDLMSQLFSNKQDTEGQSVCHVVSMEEDKVVGSLWYNIEPSTNKAYIYHILVGEEYRKKGIATAVLQKLEEDMRNRGVTSMGLNVFGTNPHAYELYEKLGYRVLSTYMGKRI